MNRKPMRKNSFLWAIGAVVGLGFTALQAHAVTIPDGTTLVATYDNDPVLGGTIVFEGTSGLILSNDSANTFGNLGYYQNPIVLNSATGTITAMFPSGQCKFNGAITGSGTLIITNAAGANPSWVFQNAGITWTGMLRLGAGTYNIFDVNPFGDSSNTVVLDQGGDAVSFIYYYLPPHVLIPQNIVISARFLSYVFGGDSVTNSGIISGSGYVEKGNPGELALTGNNTFEGGVVLTGGQLTFCTNNNLGVGQGITIQSQDATLKIIGAVPGLFNKEITVYNSKLSIEVEDASASATWGGALGDCGHTTAVITKKGPGRLNLATNSVSAGYGGYMNFVVSNGVLGINYSDGWVGDVTVKSGGALGGTGKLELGSGKSVSIEGGGALAPGNENAAGTLTITGAVTLAENACYNWDYATGASDLTVVNGSLTLPTAATVTVTQLSGTMPVNPAIFSATSLAGASDLSGWTIMGFAGVAKIVGNNVILQQGGVKGTVISIK